MFIICVGLKLYKNFTLVPYDIEILDENYFLGNSQASSGFSVQEEVVCIFTDMSMSSVAMPPIEFKEPKEA